MRKRILWFLFLALIGQLSQAQLQFQQSGDMLLTITVQNTQNRNIIVEINPISLATRPSIPNQRKMVLDQTNKGEMKIALKGPASIKLMRVWDDQSVNYIAMPGVDLDIQLDVLQRDSLSDRGKGHRENDFYFSILDKSNEQLKMLPQNDPVLYLERWEQERSILHELITDAQNSGMNEKYTAWIWNSAQSLFQRHLFTQLMTFVTVRRQWPANIGEYEKKGKYLTSIQLNEPQLFTSETDAEMVESYYLFFSLIQMQKKGLPASDAETVYKEAISKAGKLKAESVKKLMLKYLGTSGVAHTTDTAFLKWMKLVFGREKDQYFEKFIVERERLLKAAGKGINAPFFEAIDAGGKQFSYMNYQGKYLYIDIWATWCMPCRQEIPYLEALKKNYADKPIEFISVSTDSRLAIWKKFIGSEVGDDQFYSEPGKKNSISEIYRATYIPAFILIDPNGKVINPRSFRPSDPALSLLLDVLLTRVNDQSKN